MAVTTIDFGESDFTFFWYLVEPCKECSHQLLFARTRTDKIQNLTLYRNYAEGNNISFFQTLTRLFYSPETSEIGNESGAGQLYIDYHKSHKASRNALSKKIEKWEDPFYYFKPDYPKNFISQLIQTQDNPPPLPAAERLIRLKGNRDVSSWVCISSRLPAHGEIMEIGISYSGDSDNPTLIGGARLKTFFIKRK